MAEKAALSPVYTEAGGTTLPVKNTPGIFTAQVNRCIHTVDGSKKPGDHQLGCIKACK